jgi:hypothetical protein
MFRPNRKCRLLVNSGESDLYGQPKPGRWVTEGCSLVRQRVTADKSSVRADSSASRGNAREIVADVVILMTTVTQANIDDVIAFGQSQFRITGKEPRYDVRGQLDHYEIQASIWSVE